MMELNFFCEKKILARLKQNKTFALMCFLTSNRVGFPIYISDQEFENSIDLLLLIDKYKSHYVYIKDFDRFMFHKTKKKKQKNTFARVLYSALVVKMFWQNIKKFVWALMAHNL